MDSIRVAMNSIEERTVSKGGFALRQGGHEQPDATAWACLLLAAARRSLPQVESGYARLAALQADDGRLSVDPGHVETIWPTALALLAWRSSSAYGRQCERAAHYLLETSGAHWPQFPRSPLAHDTDILGWGWTERGHAWVEPTAMAVMALRALGRDTHLRVRAGVALLLNRQLSDGGWNYGNTKVFGTELRPNVESTGMALHALAGLVALHEVERSLDYLRGRIDRLSTPLSLGWGVLGLRAWEEPVEHLEDRVGNCLRRQEYVGPYDTPALSLVLLPLVRSSPLWHGGQA